MIVTRRAAEKLFPGQDPLGKTVYVWTTPSRIVGVVEELARPNNIVRQPYSLLMPVRQTVGSGYYLLRTDSAQRDGVRVAAVDALLKADRERVVVKQGNLDDVRKDYFRQDAAMAWLLVGRLRGAARRHRARHRRPGELLGAAAHRDDRHPARARRDAGADPAVLPDRELPADQRGSRSRHGRRATRSISSLMAHYELPRLPWIYLPIGALVLWLLGQLAVLGPALRAASLPPVAVMRLR